MKKLTTLTAIILLLDLIQTVFAETSEFLLEALAPAA
jgi:hypothetical protein